jgi:peptidoglycan/xylan/chitin deacetylase (PgdA/CDA1 family)
LRFIIHFYHLSEDFRPPYGDVDDRVRAIIKAMGLRNIMWAVDSTDSLTGQSAAGIATVAKGWMSAGIYRAISLEHDLLELSSRIMC